MTAMASTQAFISDPRHMDASRTDRRLADAELRDWVEAGSNSYT